MVAEGPFCGSASGPRPGDVAYPTRVPGAGGTSTTGGDGGAVTGGRGGVCVGGSGSCGTGGTGGVGVGSSGSGARGGMVMKSEYPGSPNASMPSPGAGTAMKVADVIRRVSAAGAVREMGRETVAIANSSQAGQGALASRY